MVSTQPDAAMIGATEARAALRFDVLIPALRKAFAEGATVPPRHHHAIPRADGSPGTLLLMPAWQAGGYLGVKIATVFPGNGARGLPAVHSTYLLRDASTGRPLALIDGDEITERRTVAVSALAASCLARADAASLLIVGSGRIAALAADAFSAVRPIRRVAVWARRPTRAEALAERLRAAGHDAAAALSLPEAVRAADIISCATLATEPLIHGDWLAPGAHLDLIGSFTPAMREADDACFARSRICVDTRDALAESGDLAGPIACGALAETAIVGTLADLVRGVAPGRISSRDITLFKAIGTGLADLAAAALVHRARTGASGDMH
jgi:ornithine cyclodeaminase